MRSHELTLQLCTRDGRIFEEHKVDMFYFPGGYLAEANAKAKELAAEGRQVTSPVWDETKQHWVFAATRTVTNAQQ